MAFDGVVSDLDCQSVLPLRGEEVGLLGEVRGVGWKPGDRLARLAEPLGVDRVIARGASLRTHAEDVGGHRRAPAVRERDGGLPGVRALGLGPLEDSGRLVRHDGRWSDRDLGARACFAAVGPGELVLDGRKVLGISQRRTRAGARFQCLAYRRWDPESLLGLLAGAGVGGSEWGDGAGPDALRSALVERAGAVVPDGWDVVERLLPVLP